MASSKRAVRAITSPAADSIPDDHRARAWSPLMPADRGVPVGHNPLFIEGWFGKWPRQGTIPNTHQGEIKKSRRKKKSEPGRTFMHFIDQ